MSCECQQSMCSVWCGTNPTFFVLKRVWVIIIKNLVFESIPFVSPQMSGWCRPRPRHQPLPATCYLLHRLKPSTKPKQNHGDESECHPGIPFHYTQRHRCISATITSNLGHSKFNQTAIRCFVFEQPQKSIPPFVFIISTPSTRG